MPAQPTKLRKIESSVHRKKILVILIEIIPLVFA